MGEGQRLAGEEHLWEGRGLEIPETLKASSFPDDVSKDDDAIKFFLISLRGSADL